MGMQQGSEFHRVPEFTSWADYIVWVSFHDSVQVIIVLLQNWMVWLDWLYVGLELEGGGGSFLKEGADMMDLINAMNERDGEGIAYSSGGTSCGGGKWLIKGKGVDLPMSSLRLSIAWLWSILDLPRFDALMKLPSIRSSDKFIMSLSVQSGKLKKGESFLSKFCGCMPRRAGFMQSKLFHVSDDRCILIAFGPKRSLTLVAFEPKIRRIYLHKWWMACQNACCLAML